MMAQLKGLYADRLARRGELDAALKIRETEALPVYEALGDKRSIAVTKGKIADILMRRGDLDAALKIRETEELPVFEALGDKSPSPKAKIADIMEARGDLDGALKSARPKNSQSTRRLATNALAVTKGKIADITRGDLDGALKIRETEELPVYETLGDIALYRRHKRPNRRYPHGPRGSGRRSQDPRD